MRAQRIGITCTLAFLVAACGGTHRSGSPADASGTAPATASGTVTGVGTQLTVDGVPYDVSGASVTDDTDPANPLAVTLADLQLGQHVDAALDGAGRLRHIGIGATLAGLIDAGSLDAAAGTFTVLAQPVAVTATGDGATRFVGIDGAAALAEGQLVMVHGRVDAKGVIAARLVVVMPDGAKPIERVSGTVASTDAAAKTFKLGQLTVDFAAAKLIPADATIADGKAVVVFSTKATTGTAPALTLAAETVLVLHVEPRSVTIRLGGPITAVTPVAGQAIPNLTLPGLEVDCSNAKLASGTTAEALVVGALVRVEGTLAKGVLAAAEIAVISKEVEHRVVLVGQVSSYVGLSSFVVHGTTVDGSSARFTEGSSANQLADGVAVTILGHASASGVVADQITVHQPPKAIEMTLRGVVRGYDATAQTFELAGFAMKLDAAVTWTGGTAADLADGKHVKVTGSYDGAVFVVKAVEFVPDPSAAPPPARILCGVISDLTPTSFLLDGTKIALTASTEIDDGPLRNGQRVLVAADADASGTLTARKVAVVADDASGRGHRPAFVTGPISEVTDATTFKVDAQAVDASKAAFLPRGKSAKDLVVGAVVDVGGEIADGVLTAKVIVFR